MATKNLGQAAAILKSATAPSNTDVIWQDTSVTPNSFKTYDSSESAWVPLKPSFGIEGQVPRMNVDGNDFVYSNNVDTADGGSVRVYDATGSDTIELSHDGTDANVGFTNTTDLNINDGVNVKIYDATNTDYIQISHDGTDTNFDFTGTTDLNINDVGFFLNKTNTVTLGISDQSMIDGDSRSILVSGTQDASLRRSQLAVYSHAGITGPVAFLRLDPNSGAARYYWTDNSSNLRVSTNIDHTGTTSGTVVGTQTSDIRLKDVAIFNYGLSDLLKIEPIAFTYKNDLESIPRLGFSAQQVSPIIREAVYDTKEDIDGTENTKLGMDYSSLIPVLVQAIKELEARVSKLESQINS